MLTMSSVFARTFSVLCAEAFRWQYLLRLLPIRWVRKPIMDRTGMRRMYGLPYMPLPWHTDASVIDFRSIHDFASGGGVLLVTADVH